MYGFLDQEVKILPEMCRVLLKLDVAFRYMLANSGGAPIRFRASQWESSTVCERGSKP
jgi:hypothetical protein